MHNFLLTFLLQIIKEIINPYQYINVYNPALRSPVYLVSKHSTLLCFASPNFSSIIILGDIVYGWYLIPIAIGMAKNGCNVMAIGKIKIPSDSELKAMTYIFNK